MGLDVKNGWRIFCRDRYNHASPNSAQTESVCAGLLESSWRGCLLSRGAAQKPYIGDPLPPGQCGGYPRVCRLMTLTSVLALVLLGGVPLLFLR